MFLDLLIAIFFFLVGLEIRAGLRSLRSAIVPVVAAIGGMIVPVAIFLIINPNSQVWATSMPTDIALALGTLSLLGKRVSVDVRLFLLTLAIADDLFSLIVLGLFYGDDLHPAKALSTLGAAAIGLILPLRANQMSKLIKILTPLSTYFIVPVIVITNIPLNIDLSSFGSRTTLSLLIARFLGKIIGITLFAWLCIRCGARTNISLREIMGVAILAGMGLTVALVIADIVATTALELNQIRLGLFICAIISGICGYMWLRKTPVAQ